ncbi:hypothetical protein Glove_130g138 [Diversispora epigaea]|uniref:Uncharacterized protein n=1 Tax=Diversispora epigaea TaxID=1348612 RepID=A0A397J720_9GLOM|nr:hypothetical protein Glove_130g138 [Diversispora epigaea]
MSEVKEKEFELFFTDKANVNMSSYKVDSKTQLPILYIKDQKNALWNKFSAIYPDGMKRTSFMARLQNGRFKYREDLGGLCLTCNDYGYQPFRDLIELVITNFSNQTQKNNLIHELENLQHYLRRKYEKEFVINKNGTINHTDCINHCLQYAFGECTQQHFSRCPECDKFFYIFEDLKTKFDIKHYPKLDEYQEKLIYKANVNMSSYKVDSKTQLPILYIKDQKNALWNKFSAIYPDGMKRTSFMARLQNGRFKYREDLGGLCLTCNDYGYQPFRDLIELVITNFSNQTQKNNLIHELENLQHYLRRKYEKEFVINKNGTINHTDCINHCLQYAFGECTQQHFSRCPECDKFFYIFEDLKTKFDIKHYPKLDEYQEKLICYLAHQTRKSYLNTQFNSILYELDNYGAIIIVDYKMRILSATARETKSGKRGWTLHTTLVFRKDKNNNEKLDIQAYDHWSSDTKQDAWFTASYFECVFLSINPKPNWIKIISDNGGHYHNSELMVIISCWYDWYNIEVRGWIFLEPGEAKTTVDSHHAVIAHAIKRYIRVGHSLTNGEDIEKALHNLSGTSVSHIEPDRDINKLTEQDNVPINLENKKSKTIPGISKWFEWTWPITGEFAGYVCARSLPHIGNWINFSPAQISNFCGTIHRPSPIASEPTKTNSSWTMPISKKINLKLSINSTENRILTTSEKMETDNDLVSIDHEFPLKKGWALKENIKLGNKGGGKRISKRVVQYLQGFFLAGNLRAVNHYSPENMHVSLLELVEEGELALEEIPTVKTIKGWIGRYSASFKKTASERALVESNKENKENISETNVEGNSSQIEPRKRQKKDQNI